MVDAAADTESSKTWTGRRLQLTGRVVRDKMQKTVVVMTLRRVKHPKYGKYFVQRKKYKAHDEQGKARYGDLVLIEECRRLSKEKRFLVRKVLQSAEATN